MRLPLPSPRSLLLVLAVSAGSLFAADLPLPELRGILSLGGSQRFSLSTPSATETAWVGVGEEFSGYKIVSYSAAEETLVVSKDGRQFKVKMLSSSTQHADAQGTKATLADADAVIRKMNLESMLRKTIEQQKKMGVQMARQMSARAGTEVDEKDLAAFQEKVMGTLFNDETIKAMSDDMTRIYSEVFSKEELQGLSDFYSTSTGIAMVEKTPAVQEKLAQAMMPRMMANMGKVQQLGAEFAQQQQAKKAAAQQAAAASAATSAAPATPAAPATTATAPGK